MDAVNEFYTGRNFAEYHAYSKNLFRKGRRLAKIANQEERPERISLQDMYDRWVSKDDKFLREALRALADFIRKFPGEEIPAPPDSIREWTQNVLSNS